MSLNVDATCAVWQPAVNPLSTWEPFASVVSPPDRWWPPRQARHDTAAPLQHQQDTRMAKTLTVMKPKPVPALHLSEGLACQLCPVGGRRDDSDKRSPLLPRANWTWCGSRSIPVNGSWCRKQRGLTITNSELLRLAAGPAPDAPRPTILRPCLSEWSSSKPAVSAEIALLSGACRLIAGTSNGIAA